MKLAVAIAPKEAPPDAFVVLRGIEESIPKAADYGYRGVELALKSADEVNRRTLNRLLAKYDMEVSCISTGQLFAGLGLFFTHPEQEIQTKLTIAFRKLIDLAADYGGMVNVGRVRGPYIGTDSSDETEERFIHLISDLCDYADRYGVTLVIEPVNRYELNFINTISEADGICRRINRSNIGIMPDLFHMNIEESDICSSLYDNRSFIKYIHFADSNRFAPGMGHLDFDAIMNTLFTIGYNGWISLELLPEPDPESAAAIGAQAILGRLKPDHPNRF